MAKQIKLSKTQQKVLDTARAEIAAARKHETVEEYFNNECHGYNNDYNTAEKFKAKNPKDWEYKRVAWEQKNQGIVRTWAKTETLNKLMELGLIEIIEIDEKYRLDTIRVID